MISTYMSDDEAIALRQNLDRELLELLEEVRKATNSRWEIRRTTKWVRRWFRSNLTETYSVYAYLAAAEWQVINFAPTRRNGWTINTDVERFRVLDYLMGILVGSDRRFRFMETHADGKA